MKHTAYLSLSARIRAMENRLLTPERMGQILQARDDREVERILTECGYPAFDVASREAVEKAVRDAWRKLFAELGEVPGGEVVELFRIKHDYQNLKVLLKGEWGNVKPPSGEEGRVAANTLAELWREGETLPGRLSAAAEEGREVLRTTRDPQQMEIAADRWYCRELLETANRAQSGFLQGYARLLIDSANLRTLVRWLRMGKSPGFLSDVLTEGGQVSVEEICSAIAGEGGVARLWASTPLEKAGEKGAEAVKGGSLTEFERLCDNAVSAYLAAARFIPFGEEPVLSYLAARETEFTNLRILLLGRQLGLEEGVIRSRLRESCV